MKKILALVLSVIMAVSLLPAAVFAAGEPVITIGISDTDGDGILEKTEFEEQIENEYTTPFSANIENGVKTIGEKAFYSYGNKMKSVTIPDTVKTIEESAFRDCAGLESVAIPEGVKTIGNEVFAGCTNLKSVVIPNSVTEIGDDAFNSCVSLTSIAIPNKVTVIAPRTFSGCKAITTITIPDGVTEIGDDAFNGCESLTSIKIPDGVTKIGLHAFVGCEAITTIKIPDGVTQIGEKTFISCTGLTSITIPESVTTIGADAFYNCTSLNSITIPKSVTDIGDRAFTLCSSLTTINLPCNFEESMFTNTGVQVVDRSTYKIGTTNGEFKYDHAWNKGVVTTKPTETTEGVKTYTCTECNTTKTEPIAKLPTKPVEVTGGGTTVSDPERDFWYEVRKEVEASDKGDVVTVNAEEYNSMPWYVMDALRDNGVGMKIYWDGETIKIPAGKALNEKWRVAYPFEYLAKYNFDKMAEEIPAVPETGAPVNAVIIMAFAMAAAGTAIILKRKIK